MQRVPEQELMENAAQVAAYANADFSQPHDEFVERIKAFVNQPLFSGNALDIGCGPGDISRRFARVFPLCHVDAIDGSLAMIDFAIKTTGLELAAQLKFIHGKLPGAKLSKPAYDIIYSNSVLHHLPDPLILWRAIKEYAKPGAKVCVMDLLRPESTIMASTLVTQYAGDEPKILKEDFYNSLLAAFTLKEVREQLEEAQLNFTVEQISDRHVFISGSVT